MISSLLQDVGYSWRTLRRQPGFALLAILTVALGIGVNTAMFTIVHGVLWKPLPYPDADRLVMFNESSSSGVLNCSHQNLYDWKARSGQLAGLAVAREFPPAILRLDNLTDTITTGYAHPDLFALLGVPAAANGRLFTAAEDNAAAEPVGVITQQAWQRYFGGDPSVIGRPVKAHISFEGFTVDSIVIGGILPDGFRYENVDLWLPLNRFWGKVDAMRGNHWFRGIGKLKPGATVESARRELDGIAQDLERQYPATNKNVRPKVASLIDYYTGTVRPALLLLMGAVGFVMLIACGNVVHLLLTRTLGRRREMAVRLALGAARGRLLQLLLAEGLLVTLVGGVIGLVLSHWGVVWAIASQPKLLPRAKTIDIDAPALWFTLAVAFFTFCVLGLTPLWQASRANVAATLQSAGRGGTDRKQRRLGWSMVAAELAMASILLAGAGLMIRTLHQVSQIPLGYQPENVLAVTVGLPGYKFTDNDAYSLLTQRVLEETKALPGVVASAYAEPFGVGGNGMLPPMTVPGRENPEPAPMIPTTTVSREFFTSMGIPLHAGRFPAPHPERREALVNEEFARIYFPGESPVGREIDIGGPMEIVGVVGNTRLQGAIATVKPELYWSSEEYGTPTLLVRTKGAPGLLAPALRGKLKAIEPDIRLGAMRPLSDDEADRSAVRRFMRGLLLVFAGLAVFLASLGIFGVVSYTVAQRTREIGIRMALGATRRNVATLVLQQTLGATLAGVAIGVGGAVFLSKFLGNLLYGVSSREPVVYLGVIGVIAAVALAASLPPMFRASRVDPAHCLRDE